MSFIERKEILEAFKNVDEVVPTTWEITEKLEKYQIDYLFLGQIIQIILRMSLCIQEQMESLARNTRKSIKINSWGHCQKPVYTGAFKHVIL